MQWLCILVRVVCFKSGEPYVEEISVAHNLMYVSLPFSAYMVVDDVRILTSPDFIGKFS